MMTLVPSELSDAAGVPKVHAVPHSTVLLAGQLMKLGGVVSTTVTREVQVVLLPHWSVALQVRTAWKVRPQSTLVIVLTNRTTTLVPSQLSVADGGTKLQAAPIGTVWAGAQVITGGVVSTTVTVWLQTALLEQASVARQVRRTV
jgi:hypothetical protein